MSRRKILGANKFRNAGQVCVSPTRFLVQEPVYQQFVDKFVAAAKAVKVGDGLKDDTRMGPLAHSRRLDAVEAFVTDAVSKGAKLETGGRRIGNKGYLLRADRPDRGAARSPHHERGAVRSARASSTRSAASTRRSRRRTGCLTALPAYAYTRSTKTAAAIGHAIESGMVSINHHGLALPEVRFGGVKDSGYGSEGGADALDAYLNTKFITQLNG